MKRSARVALWAALWGAALAGSVGQAAAQYYQPPPPPPGYYPPPGYPPPPPRRFRGLQCDAFLPTAYGPQRTICPLDHPRPLDEPCRCPPPPNYPPGPWLRGRVVR